MAKSLRNAGQVKMCGKKYRLMLCGCCECQDLRDGIIKKLVKDEARLALAEKEEPEIRYFGEIPL